MDAHVFDALTKTLSRRPSRRTISHAVLAGIVGGLSGPLLGLSGGDAKRRKKKRRRPCRNCGPDRYCEQGTCSACKPLATACTTDVQCCSGICDSYRDECAEVRFGCNPNVPRQCPNNGICCDLDGEGEFTCVDDPQTNQKLCGTSCQEYVNCFNFGNDAQCRSGTCCCGGPNCVNLPPC